MQRQAIVTLPHNAYPGTLLRLQVGNTMLQITVPHNAQPGQQITVALPPMMPTAVPSATPAQRSVPRATPAQRSVPMASPAQRSVPSATHAQRSVPMASPTQRSHVSSYGNAVVNRPPRHASRPSPAPKPASKARPVATPYDDEPHPLWFLGYAGYDGSAV